MLHQHTAACVASAHPETIHTQHPIPSSNKMAASPDLTACALIRPCVPLSCCMNTSPLVPALATQLQPHCVIACVCSPERVLQRQAGECLLHDLVEGGMAHKSVHRRQQAAPCTPAAPWCCCCCCCPTSCLLAASGSSCALLLLLLPLLSLCCGHLLPQGSSAPLCCCAEPVQAGRAIHYREAGVAMGLVKVPGVGAVGGHPGVGLQHQRGTGAHQHGDCATAPCKDNK